MNPSETLILIDRLQLYEGLWTYAIQDTPTIENNPKLKEKANTIAILIAELKNSIV